MRVIIRNRMQLEKAKEELSLLRDAWRRILEAQSYTIDTRQVNRASLKQIEAEISDYEQAIDAYETRGSTKRRVARLVPLDK